MIFTILISLPPPIILMAFLEDCEGQIATFQKMSQNMDAAKLISASTLLTFFGKWLFDLLGSEKPH